MAKFLIVVEHEGLRGMLCSFFLHFARKLGDGAHAINQTRGGKQAIRFIAEKPNLMITDDKISVANKLGTVQAARKISPKTAVILIKDNPTTADYATADAVITESIVVLEKLETIVRRLLKISVIQGSP